MTVVDSSGEARWADGLHVEVAGNPWDCMPHAFLDVRVDGTVLWDRPGL